MIVNERLQKYAFFSGLEEDEIVTLAQLGEEAFQEMGTYFFREDEELSRLYLVNPVSFCAPFRFKLRYNYDRCSPNILASISNEHLSFFEKSSAL